ncbi:MAG: tRNA 2-thiouridine(34) synthase MnmA [Acidobacteria bacterium]|nr:tRNA 2-thiouridine(34) synthase MnmA [Acidobacteriota bacterium]
MKGRVVVAMSGGIDSSVCAWMLKQDGWDVIGVSMQLHMTPEGKGTAGPCCSARDFGDAKAVAETIGIPHYVVNYTDEFREKVIRPFIETYLKGMTPSPCILCNTHVKFFRLMHFAQSLGAGYLATGHYAAINRDEAIDRHILLRGTDPRKDQSYFLFELEQDQLRKTLFPLGRYRKQDVRELAASARLPVARKAESQEICFIPDGDYTGYIDRALEAGECEGRRQPGPIVLRDGTPVGTHHGLHHYTVGQRRGLGGGRGGPLYVIGIDACANRLVVGEKADVFSRRFQATRCNWVAVPSLDAPVEADVKIRSAAKPARARIEPLPGGRVAVTFETPQSAVTPGQAAVFYWEDVVLGGGWIYHVDHAVAPSPRPPQA